MMMRRSKFSSGTHPLYSTPFLSRANFSWINVSKYGHQQPVGEDMLAVQLQRKALLHKNSQWPTSPRDWAFQSSALTV